MAPKQPRGEFHLPALLWPRPGPASTQKGACRVNASFGIYFPIKEVAARLSKCPRTIKTLAEKGELGPVWKIGGELTVSETGLLAFMARHEADFSSGARELRRQAIARRLKVPVVRGPFTPGIAARSEGELKRKVIQLNTHEGPPPAA